MPEVGYICGAMPLPALRLSAPARWTVLRVALLGLFLGLAGRFWHPYYGFTIFLQIDAEAGQQMLPELRGAPIFVHPYAGNYDGGFYAQLAARPAVNDPALDAAVDHVPYRARRMLGSWLAWLAGGGDAVRAVHAYAALNVVAWLALAAVLWRIFPVADWRTTLAWAGVLFSAGALGSVRLALTDLPALLLVALGVAAATAVRPNRAVGWLAAALLARETAVLAAITLWPREWRSALGRPLLRGALVVLPFALWLVYLQWRLGPDNPGWSNLTWPGAGFLGKWAAEFAALTGGGDRLLAVMSLLANFALTVQAAYFVWRREPGDPWWRLGAVYGTLLLCLGAAVWEGQPGAATRVLLPLALAFNVVAVRARAGLGWLLLGNLSIGAGVLALGHVPTDPHELAAGRFSAGAYVVHTDARWFQTEVGHTKTWAWCGSTGALQLDIWPHLDQPRRIAVAVRAFRPRELEIRDGAALLWRGRITERVQWVELPPVAPVGGRLTLELRSGTSPDAESAGGRGLSFAVYGVKVLD